MAKREPKASHALDQFAEDLGRILGTAQSKAEGWLGQRQQIAQQLTQIRDSASELLSKLTSGSASVVSSVRRGRPPGSGKKARRPKGRTLSAKARKAISDAQKARWAKVKAGEGKK